MGYYRTAEFDGTSSHESQLFAGMDPGSEPHRPIWDSLCLGRVPGAAPAGAVVLASSSPPAKEHLAADIAPARLRTMGQFQQGK